MNFLSWCKKEFIRILPVTLFFLVAFTLVNVTDKARNISSITYYSFFSCVVAALIMGKVVLITDALHITGIFSDKPLIYATIWKSFLYVVCSILLRLIEHIVPAIYTGQSWELISQQIAAHIQMPLFWIMQTWLCYLFIIFVGYRELVYSVGSSKVRKLFFG